MALPCSRRKISRSASQWPKVWRSVGLRRPLGDGAGSRDEGCARLAAVTWSPLPAGFGQVTVKTGSSTFRPVDVPIDRLVTDGSAALAVQLQPPGDLLWRPAALELVDDVVPQDFVPAQLAQPLAALPGAILRGEREVSGIFPLLAEVVAADFAMDGGAVPAELLGDGGDRHLGVQQAEDRAALVEIELPIGSGHEGTPSCKLLQNLQSRTSRWKPPRLQTLVATKLKCPRLRKVELSPEAILLPRQPPPLVAARTSCRRSSSCPVACARSSGRRSARCWSSAGVESAGPAGS